MASNAPNAEAKTGSIIIKKIKKGGHGHHGGAWKVAFADFAVAMMAFFLVMWLMANTTPEEKKQISGFFIEPEKYQSLNRSGSGGASNSLIDLNSGKKDTSMQLKTVSSVGDMEYQKEKMRLDNLKVELSKKLDANPELKAYKNNIIMESTGEGLNIQIVDDVKGAMFESGSTELKDKTIEILKTLAKTINQVPNKISITGHTDAKPFTVAGSNKSNWELSSERANAARRLLVENGLEDDKISKVVGLASTALFDSENPEAPTNRRISITILRHEGQSNPSPGSPPPPTSTSTNNPAPPHS